MISGKEDQLTLYRVLFLEETMIRGLGTDYSMHGDAGDAKTSLVRAPIASKPAPL
jgi:hypothetical protein